VSDTTGGFLQHPRRSLGNRHRSQAEKFLGLSEKNPNDSLQNLNWAEQSARQAVLHDFTHEENWRVLAKIKTKIGDEAGLRAVLEDLFAILGRNPEHLNQLIDVDMLEHGYQLLCASLAADPLDPDYWYENVNSEYLIQFKDRFFQLDLTDPRANIIFSRRLERIRKLDEDMFILLIRRLLAQRPFNHEPWIQLGHLHEKRNEFDDAWFCFDQAQQYFPQLTPRDDFRARMENRLDGSQLKWKEPEISSRDDFLLRMQNLALKFNNDVIHADKEDEISTIGQQEDELINLISNKEYSSAFFLARRLVTNGEDWAEKYLTEAHDLINNPTI